MIHRINGLREFRATLLVDTAGIDPHPIDAMGLGEGAALQDLFKASALLLPALLEFLKRHFRLIPAMGQNRILGDLTIDELFEL